MGQGVGLTPARAAFETLEKTMLTIRAEQMKVLGEAIQRRFETRMAAYLRRAYADHVAQFSDERLFDLIRQGIRDSAQYGVVTERDVARYIGYTVTYGPEFHCAAPWAAEILQTPKLNGTQKMDRLDAYDLFADRGGGVPPDGNSL